MLAIQRYWGIEKNGMYGHMSSGGSTNIMPVSCKESALYWYKLRRNIFLLYSDEAIHGKLNEYLKLLGIRPLENIIPTDNNVLNKAIKIPKGRDILSVEIIFVVFKTLKKFKELLEKEANLHALATKCRLYMPTAKHKRIFENLKNGKKNVDLEPLSQIGNGFRTWVDNSLLDKVIQ